VRRRGFGRGAGLGRRRRVWRSGRRWFAGSRAGLRRFGRRGTRRRRPVGRKVRRHGDHLNILF